jgi:two-component sensor histidine kinase
MTNSASRPVHNKERQVTYSQSMQTLQSTDPWLLIAEMEHRVANEYTLAVASLSVAAARTTSAEAKDILADAATRLRSYADAHRALQAPSAGGPIDLTAYLRQICHALVCASLCERGIQLTLIEQQIQLEPERCWRVGLIIAELITNATRHAFQGRPGQIIIELAISGGDIQCRVTDNGQPSSNVRQGHGSHIISALAAELGGTVKRQFSGRGTSILLSFREGASAGDAR